MSKNIDRDLMLMALLTKCIEIIDIEPSPQYNSLKDTLETEIKTIRTRLNSTLPPIKKPQKKSSPMSDEDKQFVVDELLGILKGSVGGTQTYTPNPAVSKFFTDYFKSSWDMDYETDKKKKDAYENMKKWNSNDWDEI